MLFLEWLFLTMAPCDAAEPWQLGFQDAATPMMQGIIDLHHDIFFFLILILVFVSRILVRALWHFHYKYKLILQRIWVSSILVRALWHFHYEKNPILQRIGGTRGLLVPLVVGVLAFSYFLAVQGGNNPGALSKFIKEYLLMMIGNCDGREAYSPAPLAGLPHPPIPPQMPEAPPAPAPEVSILFIHPEDRRTELEQRFLTLSFGRPEALDRFNRVVDYQMFIDERVLNQLMVDGFNPVEVIQRRHEIRGFALYPMGRPLSTQTYLNYWTAIEQNGASGTIPYQRVRAAIGAYHLLLNRIRIGGGHG